MIQLDKLNQFLQDLIKASENPQEAITIIESIQADFMERDEIIRTFAANAPDPENSDDWTFEALPVTDWESQYNTLKDEYYARFFGNKTEVDTADDGEGTRTDLEETSIEEPDENPTIESLFT